MHNHPSERTLKSTPENRPVFKDMLGYTAEQWRLGIPNKRRSSTLPLSKQVSDYMRKGHSRAETARHFGITPYYVSKFIKKHEKDSRRHLKIVD